MAQRGRRTTLEERIELGERWEAGQTDPGVAVAMGRSVWTVRKWRRKHQREGQPGLVSCMGRPATGALGQFPPEVRDTVREMRKIRLAVQRLTRAELMGELSPLTTLPVYQLALSFSRSTWREIMLCSDLTGTTF